MPFDRQQPYNYLPLLPPASELESKAVLKQVIEARMSQAELKGATHQLPNQSTRVEPAKCPPKSSAFC